VEDSTGARANIPETQAPDELSVAEAHKLLSSAGTGSSSRQLGVDPDTGNLIIARDGRFGPYVSEELPEGTSSKIKPRTASLFKTMSLDTITLEQALQLLTLPRLVGEDAGEQITASNGRYGPYIQKGKDSRSLADEEQLLTITLDEAKALLAQPKTYGRTRTTGTTTSGRALGEDPETGKTITIKDGRFGPYVTDGETNATLRRSDSPDTIELTRAIELLAEKRAKGPTTSTTRRRTTAKKPAAKKPAAKKTATK
jgi:DNA topoisomerase-1